MGPKKKDKKSKKADDVVQEESEYDTMDLEMLREVVPMLRQQLEKSMLDRNYVQLERVFIFLDNHFFHSSSSYQIHIIGFNTRIF